MRGILRHIPRIQIIPAGGIAAEIIQLQGHIKATVKRANGFEFVHCDDKNTIQTDLKEYLAQSISATTDESLNNLFNGNDTLGVAQVDEDGIWVEHTSTQKYEMICSWSSPSSTSRKLTGTFTGTGITIAAVADVMMGHKWNNGTTSFDSDFAAPTSWSSLALAAADTLTIEWTITVS